MFITKITLIILFFDIIYFLLFFKIALLTFFSDMTF